MRLVALALADMSNDEGYCWPSLASLCVRCCLGEKSIRRQLRGLKDHGLQVEHRFQDGRQQSNGYRWMFTDAHPPSHPREGEAPMGAGGEGGAHATQNRHSESSDEPSLLLSSPNVVVTEWNKHEELPSIRTLTPSREATLKTRMKNQFFQENWREAIQRIVKSDFCKGSKGWRADFNWFIKPDTVAKVMEGKYDNRAGDGSELDGEQPERQPPCPDWRERAERLTGKPHKFSWSSHEKTNISLREQLLEDMSRG